MKCVTLEIHCQQCTEFMETLLILNKGAMPFLFTHSTFIRQPLCIRNGLECWGYIEQNTILVLREFQTRKISSLGKTVLSSWF